MPKPLPLIDFPTKLKEGTTYGPYTGYVDRIVDGDTLVLVASVGLDDYPVFYGRLKGVEAMETWEPGGDECTMALELLCGPDTHVRITTDKLPRAGTERTTLSRYVVELERMRWNMPGEPEEVVSVNEEMRVKVAEVRKKLAGEG